ncbi:MAG TPA: hypothetical protein VGG57_13840 [Stellaceae bacterium]
MPGYPQITDYNEAVQHPETAFLDSELRQGRVQENALGLPAVLSGGFALTYMVRVGRRKLAVRCFHREIPAVEQKYAAVSRAFRALKSPYFVDFEFLGQGIRVHRQVSPIVKMDWAEGEVLGLWLDRHGADRNALAALRQQFAVLAQYLKDRGIAHGDVQNGNVIVAPQGIKLVDYDGVYVPGMAVGQGCESGHKHFQHPQRGNRHHGPGIDRFSFIVIDLSLAALIDDPSLFRRYGEGGETILFHAKDFADPDHSEVFDAISRMPGLSGPTQTLARLCHAPIEAVPTLQEFNAMGTAGDAAGIGRLPPPPRPAAARYIGTYPVVDASDFAAVMNHIGRRVELVGRVVAVEQGRARGRGHQDLPCLHAYLVKGWRHVVRLTIGSDRGGFADGTGRDWVGKWVGVAGLIAQPFVADAFLMPRTQVGIAFDDPSQVNFISAAEAGHRLAQRETIPVADLPPSATPRGLSNRQLVRQLERNRPPPPAAPQPPPPRQIPLQANRALVGRLRAAPKPPPMRPRPQPRVAAALLPSARRRTGPVPAMVIHPRKPGSPPVVRARPRPPTLLIRILQAFGLAD